MSKTSFRPCAVTLRTNQFPHQLTKWKAYYTNPKTCASCTMVLSWFKRSNNFCSSSCAAAANNLKRPARSAESRIKTSVSLKRYQTKHPYRFTKQPQYSKVSFCLVCGSVIKFKHTKTCSPQCLSSYQSTAQSLRLSCKSYRTQHSYGRGKLSFLESSFKEWLDAHGVYYLHEPSFKNYTTNRTYFPDFYFPQHKLIIELDGTQHNNTKEKDAIRDHYISTTYNITILRITHKEYISMSRVLEVKEYLKLG